MIFSEIFRLFEYFSDILADDGGWRDFLKNQWGCQYS